MIKMYTIAGKWIVKDGDRIVEFDNGYDAWCFILLLKGIRPRVPYIRSLYPVTTLDPRPATVKKTITLS